MRDRIHVREMHRGDREALHAVFDGMSAASRTRRFHGPMGGLSPMFERRLLDLDGRRHVALVAEAGPRRHRRPVGIARYVRDGDGGAEIALEVVDAWHGRGVGSQLVDRLVAHARAAGVQQLYGELLPDNEPVRRLLARRLPGPRFVRLGRVVRVESHLGAGPLQLEDLMADLVPARAAAAS